MTQLSCALTQLKKRTGLSLAALAARAPYSKSSWERYLNGKTLPPREAVEELCRLAGEPAGRCLALWEIAEAETSGRGTAATTHPTPATPPPPSASPVPTPPAPTPVPQTTASGHWGMTALAVLGSVCALAVAGVVVALLLFPHHPGRHPATLPSPITAAGPRCRESTCEGRNPMAMHCAAQPDTLATHRTATGAWLQLRHSTECGTTWTRMWGGRIGDRIEMATTSRAPTVHGAHVSNSREADTYVYTVMTVTHPGTAVRACFQPAGTGRKECFGGPVR
jgi:helix-turn-helix protein/uncharacterized protein DUF2690